MYQGDRLAAIDIDRAPQELAVTERDVESSSQAGLLR